MIVLLFASGKTHATIYMILDLIITLDSVLPLDFTDEKTKKLILLH